MEKVRDQLKVHQERAILVGVILKRKEKTSHDDVLGELTALAESAGAVIVDRFIQKVNRINPATYIGSGKAKMLAGRVKQKEGDVVIFDNDLSPAQIRELEKIVECKVLDRSELILDIFATRARTKQAKLQVELAQLEYTYPRLTRMWSHLDTVAGAAGGTGTFTIAIGGQPACPWDCGDGNGAVDVADFLALLAQWGQVGTSCDFDGGGVAGEPLFECPEVGLQLSRRGRRRHARRPPVRPDAGP